MRKIIFQTARITAMILAAAGWASAAINSTGLIMYPVLDVGVGARGISLSGALTASIDDSTAIYWNPAGLARAGDQEMNMTHAAWILDSYIDYITLNVPMDAGAIGINVIYANMGFLEKRDEYGYITGPDINSHTVGGALGYGIEIFSGFYAGAALKFINQYIGDENIYALSGDAGVMYRLLDFLTVAADAQNIPIKSQYALPLNIKAGASAEFFFGDHCVNLMMDGKYQLNSGFLAAAGVEYSFLEMSFLRLGYEYDPRQQTVSGDVSGLTAGAGLYLGQFKLDYSMKFNGSLGLNHLISITMKYGQPAYREKIKQQQQQELAPQLAREDTDTAVARMMSEGINYFDTGDYQEAMNRFATIKTLKTDFKDIDKWISDTAGMIDKLKKLEEKKQKRNRLETQLNVGMELYKENKFAQALDIFKMVKKMEPEYNVIDKWINSAMAQMAKEQGEKLAPYMKQAMRAYDSCDYESAISQFEGIIRQFGENEEAVKYLKKSRQKMADLETYNQKAQKEMEKGWVIKAVKSLRKAIAACPTNIGAKEDLAKYKSDVKDYCRELYYSGIDKYTNGDLEAAMKAWEEVWELDPGCDFAKKAKEYTKRAKDKKKAIVELSR
jgi:tetratricopeptide (TPR) repeat protein/opacity protein-like surface antigen